MALGASAGGLEATEQFFAHVPPRCGVAWVVVQHLDPDHEGLLPELLQATTPMPVAQATERVRLEPDHVYVIPPGRDLSIVDDRLYLKEPEARRGLRLPIDSFLRSLAQARGEDGVAVILSGMGSDGSLGLRAVKEVGGLVVVQEPRTARFDGMPRSALETGLVDIVAPPDALPARIVDYLRRAERPATGERATEVTDEPVGTALERVCGLLYARTGHDFSSYKRSTLQRRVERRMAIHQVLALDDYVGYARDNPQEVDLLFKELLIGVTSFFRDPAVWEHLQEHVLPGLVAACPVGASLRAWVAGCSTGEEAYSLAMAFREVQERLGRAGLCSLQLFATDLDADAIAKARQGHFSSNIVADVSPARLARFFVEEPLGFRVRREIREMVVFAPHNVLMDPPFTNLDLLTCRNLLIYLGPEVQRRLLPLFHYCLRPGGVLMLGSAESVGSFQGSFEPIDGALRLFRRSGAARSANQVDFPTRRGGRDASAPAAVTPPAPPASISTIAERVLLQHFCPAAVLVNATGDLLYVSGRTGRYLEPPAGKVNWNIHAMARDGLRHPLALALPKALRSGERVVCRELRVGAEPDAPVVDVSIQPTPGGAGPQGLALVVFSDVVAPALAARGPRGAVRRKHTKDLEAELAQAHREIEALRQEMRTSHEEVKAANEELQSANEELQSTNEELTTSKEEMQSLNEELQTVNAELQERVDELSATSNDMKNLLNSTDLATVFLDDVLHLRRFTTQATRLFKLLPGDVGRPLSDVATDLAYPDLAADAQEVLRTLLPIEREVTTHDGRWFQSRILPYRTLENVIDGVVITFNDIGRAKRLEAELRAAGGHR